MPVRKPGKLPGKTAGIDYMLEYGTDRLEIHEGQVRTGSRVILVDDLIATGGTALAAAQLLREQGAPPVLALFAIASRAGWTGGITCGWYCQRSVAIL